MDLIESSSFSHLHLAAVLDQTAQTLFLTEMMRGLSLTLRAFFDKKVTVRHPGRNDGPRWGFVTSRVEVYSSQLML